MSNTKSKFDADLVRELANILRDADLGELEIEHEGLRVRVSRPTQVAPTVVQASVPAPMAAAPAPAAISAAPGASDNRPPAPANAITCPMVGTVYLSPEPGSKAFVSVGDTVKKGDTLMLVEAMKTFNPVEAPKNGKVTQIIAVDGQPVEYGEPLIVVE